MKCRSETLLCNTERKVSSCAYSTRMDRASITVPTDRSIADFFIVPFMDCPGQFSADIREHLHTWLTRCALLQTSQITFVQAKLTTSAVPICTRSSNSQTRFSKSLAP